MRDRKLTEPWASAAIPPEEPLSAQQNSSLRSRLDDYRLELQRLQDELEVRQQASHLVKSLVKAAMIEPLLKLSGKYSREVHKNDHELAKSDFKPYELKFRPEPAAGPRPVILHCIGNMAVGGLTRLVVDIIERSSDQYTHVVCTLHNPQPPAFIGARVIELGNDLSVKDFIRHIDRFKPALIHVHHCAPHSLYSAWHWFRNALLAAEAMAIPIVEGVNVPMTPYCHPAVRRYVFVSRYVQDAFAFEHCENSVIYPGSDFSLFTQRPHQFSDTIGMVYRLDESKLRSHSIDVFIRALQLRPTSKALVVGDGCLLPHFKDKVRQAGMSERFTFTGLVAYERLPEIYNQMDVFVAPVFCESFGQVTPFAMSMGIPVAAYATGALPEILDDPSVIAPTGDADALAGVVTRLLADPAWHAQVARRQQKRAQDCFSVETMVAEYVKLYSALLQKKPGGSW